MKPQEIMGLRGYKQQGFREYYFQREEDELVRNRIKDNKNVLVIGNPLSGKTRAVYQTLISLDKCDVIVPKLRDIDPEDFLIPHQLAFWRKEILVLDDLNKFVQEKNFKQLLQEFMKRGTIIVASCRKGPEYNILCKELESELSIFGEPVKIERISESDGREIAQEIGINLPSRFDGNIGSLFLPLDTMRNRFKECTEVEKGVLRSLKRLYYAGIYEGREVFLKKRIKYICEKREEIQKREYEWTELFDILETKRFIEVIDDDQMRVEEAYLEHVIEDKTLKSGLSILEEMRSLFSGDSEALVKIGNKAWYMGIVELRKAEYMKVAIKAYEEALKVYTLEHFPMNYAMTQNNLGNAYRTLATVEDKAENCKKAIKAFGEALNIYTLKDFPMDYAIIKSNLGTAYGTLAEVEDKAENCRKAIEACKEALRVITLERFPMNYANTQNNLGVVYQTLATVENKAENCRKAIEAYEEALNIYTENEFPEIHQIMKSNLLIAIDFCSKE